ncbi:MAG: selenium metabolism-associated LysR family transcriptional regulator [Anaerolineales bacterium]
MDIDRLKTFLDAAQTLNFSETAKRLHLSQSTVSKHIQDLERDLNVTLFDRSGARLQLSHSGQALLPWARQLTKECERFQEIAHSLEEDVAGPLRVACTTAAGKYILPILSTRFRRRFPNVQMSMLACRPPDVDELLRDEKVDLAVVSFEAANPDLECQYFFSDQIVLIAPPDHPWSSLPQIQPDELVRAPIIMREPTSGTRRVVLSALSAHDISVTDLDVVLELGNAEAIVAAVATGIGVSFVSYASAEFALQAGRVKEIEVSGFDLKRKICILRHVPHSSSRPAELFWSFVHDPENADLLLSPQKKQRG